LNHQTTTQTEATPETRVSVPLSVTRRTALALAGAVIIIVGALGPWAQALGGILSVKGSATTDGKFVLAVGAAVILSRILKRGAVPLVIGGITAGAVAIYDIANIQSKIDADAREFGAAVGWGLSAVLVGAVVLLVAAATNERKSLR
jgi:hypothetical protein